MEKFIISPINEDWSPLPHNFGETNETCPLNKHLFIATFVSSFIYTKKLGITGKYG